MAERTLVLDEVMQIRTKAAAGGPAGQIAALATAYGVCQGCVKSVISGDAPKHDATTPAPAGTGTATASTTR